MQKLPIHQNRSLSGVVHPLAPWYTLFYELMDKVHLWGLSVQKGLAPVTKSGGRVKGFIEVMVSIHFRVLQLYLLTILLHFLYSATWGSVWWWIYASSTSKNLCRFLWWHWVGEIMSFPTGFREGLGRASPMNGTVSLPVFLLEYQTSIFSGVPFASLPHLKW